MFKFVVLALLVASAYAGWGGGRSWGERSWEGGRGRWGSDIGRGWEGGIGHGWEGGRRGWGGGGGEWKRREVDYFAPAKYEFNYGVEDKHTGDHKQQSEVRHGDKVKGEYSFLESDGTHRIVRYEADDHNGFNAKVIRKGPAWHPEGRRWEGGWEGGRGGKW